MKKALFFTTLIGVSFLYSPVFSQTVETPDSLGLPGDNLNLYGVLDLFQKSATLEEFEKKLNAEDSKINNLDLNGNNKIDYITVKDNVNGTAHAIVLQVAINEKETQDVAVIEVDKDKNGKVLIQVVGDEQLYGKNYIIEPQDEAIKNTAGETPNPGYTGAKSNNQGDEKKSTVTNTTNNYYNTTNNADDVWYPVGSWSIINYLFFPSYVVYVSPWRWGYYPGYWNPWDPLYWHSYYYGYQYPHYHHYHGYYHRSFEYHVSGAHEYYGPRRSTSVLVNQRRESGEYRKTYSRPDLAPNIERRSAVDNKNANPNIDKKMPASGVSKDRAVNEKSPSKKNNNVNRSRETNRPSPSLRPSRSGTQHASPAPRSGSRSGNKNSGGGKRR